MNSTTKGMDYVCCNLCGQDNSRTLYNVSVRQDQLGTYGRDVWPIVMCQNCGLIYTNPRLDAAALEAYYSFENDYDAAFVQRWFIESADLQRPTWQRYLRVIGNYQPNGRLLDVGCGAGTFLIEAQQAGYNVTGQEVSPFFVDYCRIQHRLPILQGELDELPLPPQSFDIITLFDVIEHHPDPRRLVTAVQQLLRPNGLIVIGTHDIGNFYARLYKSRWRYINPVGHLTYFNRQTLTALLQDCGFHPIKSGGIHTIDNNRWTETSNKVVQFFRVVVLRALILGLYAPLTRLWPRLTRWELKLKRASLNHQKLMVRVGSQIIMDDNIICLARVNGP